MSRSVDFFTEGEVCYGKTKSPVPPSMNQPKTATTLPRLRARTEKSVLTGLVLGQVALNVCESSQTST